MRNRFGYAFLILLLCAAMGTPGVHAQGLAATVGLNFNDLGDISVSNSTQTFDNATGWHVGLWYDLPLGPIAIRPGVRYMDAGELFHSQGIQDARDSFNVQLIEIPLDLRIRLNAPVLTPYFLVGPVFRFPTKTDEDGQSRLESFSYAAEVGAGVEVNLAGLRLYPELKYSFGVSRFTKKMYSVGGVTFSPDETQQLKTIMLSIALGL